MAGGTSECRFIHVGHRCLCQSCQLQRGTLHCPLCLFMSATFPSLPDRDESRVHGLQAKQVLETMSTAGLEPGIVAIGAVLNAAKKAASTKPEGVAIVQEAWQLFNTLEKEERNAFVYSSMIGALGQANMKDEAVELFEEAASHLKPWCENASYSYQPARLRTLPTYLPFHRPPTCLPLFLLDCFYLATIFVSLTSRGFHFAGRRHSCLAQPTTPRLARIGTSLGIGGCARRKRPRRSRTGRKLSVQRG